MNTTTDRFETVYPLRTPVRTSHRGGTTEQPGYLVFKRGGRSEWDVAAACFRTYGGTWHLCQLFGIPITAYGGKLSTDEASPPERLWVDLGQGWAWENVREIAWEILGHETTISVEIMCCAFASLGRS